MQTRFIELVTAFLAEAGIDIPVTPGENLVSDPLGNLNFHIGLFESRRAVIMQAVAGVLPVADRSAFCEELLRMNSLFRGTQGATFGLEDDAVTLQSFIPMDNISTEAFIEQAVAFLEAWLFVVKHFDEIAARAGHEHDDTPDMDVSGIQNMLRI